VFPFRSNETTMNADAPTPLHATELARGERFEFGANWARFLRLLDEERIHQAELSLRTMLDVDGLEGKRFLDIGSGSGLFSLAARRLGATVHSFDYDPQSVACTAELRRRYFPDDSAWRVEEGSALDPAYLAALGTFDIVYSWGVLHHTGQMWRALEYAHRPVAAGGLLFIAIYNDMGRESERWRRIKRLYCTLPRLLRPPLAVAAMLPYEAKDLARSLLKLRPQEYVRTWTRHAKRRGMDRWRDIIDWVGGYPYEVASPNEITGFFESRGFSVQKLRRTGGLGCNEFVFRRDSVATPGSRDDAVGSETGSVA
jgi:2-polyprenyl-3-methyl-5-hydroxy-6-metoxy-1,4-benzoquinol methylase